MGLIFLLMLAAAAAGAQPLKVYSEFARLDEQGQPLAPEFPREILSPAIAQNAFTSFQVVVEEPEETPWQLYIAQNPDNAVQTTVYRETGDRLDPVALPVAGTGRAVFWMDVWRAAGEEPVGPKRPDPAEAERIKVEPQLHVNGDWVIYPMEARVMVATVPEGERMAAGTAPPGEVMRGFLCGTQIATKGVESEAPVPGQATVASLRFRNAQQDRVLAAKVPREELQKRFGACDAEAPADNPEWYFRVRDFLFQ